MPEAERMAVRQRVERCMLITGRHVVSSWTMRYVK
jgi:hypothetical protein